MGQVNLYMIDNVKKKEFKEKLSEKFELNQIAARWPAKAMAQCFYFFKNRQ